MKRREIVLSTTTAALTAPWIGPARAQPRPRSIGILVQADAAFFEPTRLITIESLQSLGAVEGRDYVLLLRYANGADEKLPQLARELVADGAEIILSTGTGALQALRATERVPVVGMGVTDAMAGLVAATGQRHRLAGIDMQLRPLNLKRLELLASCLPRGARVLTVADSNYRNGPSQRELEQAATQLGVELHAAWCDSAADLPAVLAQARRIKAVGLHQHHGQMLTSLYKPLIAMAAEAQLADIYEWPSGARQGGLMAYGLDRAELYRQYTHLAWRILQGAGPAKQPLEGPMRIVLLLNRARARQLGLKLPATLLARADEVIE